MIRRFIIITAIHMVVFGSSHLFSKTIWMDKNIYSPEGNLNVGDVIIVNVNDITNMRFTLNMNTRTTGDISSNPDVSITGFLPKISSNRNMNFRDSSTVSESGQVNISIASRLTGKGDRGTFAINGNRTYVFNGVSSRISVYGFIDPVLVRGRSIDSGYIADFRIEIKGSKEGLDIKRAPLKEKESASSALTESEKQRLIIDYLEKMIRELAR